MPGPMVMSRPGLPLRAMTWECVPTAARVSATIKGQVDVCGRGCHLMLALTLPTVALRRPGPTLHWPYGDLGTGEMSPPLTA